MNLLNVLGTDEIKVSVGGENILPPTPENWSFNSYEFNQFSFINKKPCKIKINGGKEVFLDAEEGFSYSGKSVIESFVIIESGIEYTFIGVY